LICSIRSIGQD